MRNAEFGMQNEDEEQTVGDGDAAKPQKQNAECKMQNGGTRNKP